jgi:hypothetical protein
MGTIEEDLSRFFQGRGRINLKRGTELVPGKVHRHIGQIGLQMLVLAGSESDDDRGKEKDQAFHVGLFRLFADRMQGNSKRLRGHATFYGTGSS